jgi:hypothetical protein
MSNRMSVLSRRLERFAVGFTIATFAFFLIGLYAAANNKGQVVFFFAGLVSVCLFASFFLWLAHGFAWAMIPEGPVVARKPAEELKPADALNLADAPKPAEALKPADVMKPAVAKRPTEAMKAAEEKKPAEEKVIAPEEDPPDAKYTITGRRVY